MRYNSAEEIFELVESLRYYLKEFKMSLIELKYFYLGRALGLIDMVNRLKLINQKAYTALFNWIWSWSEKEKQ